MKTGRCIFALITAALVLSLAACGMPGHDGNADASTDEPESTAATDSDALEETQSGDSEEPTDVGFEGLVFADVGVYTSKPVGLYTMRVTVRGTVRNTSAKSVDISSLPKLECDGIGYKADVGIQQLGSGESCEFVYDVKCRVDEEHQSHEWSFSKNDGVLCQGIEDVPRRIDKQVRAYIAEMIEAQRAAESDEVKQYRREAEERHREVTCFVSLGGELYHENPTCPALGGDHNLDELTIGRAIDEGYAPCELCTY